MMSRFGLTLLLILMTPAALADEASLTAYEHGRFKEAYELAAAEKMTADGLAFQARSILAECIYVGGEPQTERLKQAESLALQALQLEPDHIEGRLQLAIALSMQTRTMSLNEIDRSGYGTLSRELAEGILEEDPDNPWVNGFLSVWHVEARRVAGAFLSGMIGASVKKSETHYEAAMAADPTNLTLKWQYIRALMALNPKRYFDEIETGLGDIAEMTSKDALEEVLKARAMSYIPLVQSRKFDEIRETAIATL